MSINVSIIIVNYNTEQLLFNCLESVYKYTKDISFEVIVSDNGSTDNSIEMLHKYYPLVIVIENKENLGFGRANNRGLGIAKGKYIFYLNSDTILLNNAVKFFFDYWESADNKDEIGALGSNLCNKVLHTTHSYGYFPDFGNIWNDIKALIYNIYGYNKLALLNIFFDKKIPNINNNTIFINKYGMVEYITGADLFLKNDLYAKFDENYFLYCEETDLQYRMSRHKKKRLIISGPEIIHLEGASSKKRKENIISQKASFSYVNYTLSRIYFFSKYGIPVYKIFLMKLLTFMLWCNPFLFTKNKKYFWRLLTI